MEFLIRVVILVVITSGIVTLISEWISGILDNRKCEVCCECCPYYDCCQEEARLKRKDEKKENITKKKATRKKP